MFGNARSAEDTATVLDSEAVLREEWQAIWGTPVANGVAYRREAFARGQAALCLSGGGIRSAAFALGVLQALARKRLLTEFHYLSTVSGGGYVGAWLSRWINDAGHDAAAVQRALAARGEPPQIRRLRENSNFLTPRLGLASADTWTAVTLSVRNILINWMIFGPLLLLVALLPHIHSHLIALVPPRLPLVLMLVGGGLAAWSVYAGARHLPSHAPPDGRPDGPRLFASVVLPALGWAALAPLAFLPLSRGDVALFGSYSLLAGLLLPALAIFAGYGAAWALLPQADRSAFRANVLVWLAASVVSALALWLGFVAIRQVGPGWHNDTSASVGPVLAVLAQLLVTIVFVAFRHADDSGRRLTFDLDREWLGRLSALKVRPALGWVLLATTVLFLPRLIFDGAFAQTVNWLTGLVAMISGAVSILGGRAGLTGPGAPAGGLLARYGRLIIPTATVIFAALLLLFLSRLGLVLAEGFAIQLGWSHLDPDGRIHASLEGTFVALMLLAALMALLLWRTSSRINVNRFSLNALYRNRITRAFFGAARAARQPDPFTGFDASDNIRMHALRAEAEGRRVLLPVINVALNVVSGKRLAWQERKAAPFCITPIASGSAMLDAAGAVDSPRGAYVPSESYAGSERELGCEGTGISLATAVAISGAAASPSMGYHSSAPTAFLMTLFNVRLGAWLPNPARAGDLDRREVESSGPTSALRPLLAEMAGLTSDEGENVYLSDGGHFENLGLYEMVRRRCRFIVLSDAGCDPECRFEDLGNAIRKIHIDQEGIEIRFEELRISSRDKKLDPQFAYALGQIRYPEQAEPGWLLYIKPSIFGELPVDIRAYANTSRLFPHEPTSDQWFSESQFESYRHLGEFLAGALGKDEDYGERGLAAFFEDIRAQSRRTAPLAAPSPPPSAAVTAPPAGP